MPKFEDGPPPRVAPPTTTVIVDPTIPGVTAGRRHEALNIPVLRPPGSKPRSFQEAASLKRRILPRGFLAGMVATAIVIALVAFWRLHASPW